MSFKKIAKNLFLYAYGFLILFNPSNFFDFNLLFLLLIVSFIIILFFNNSLIDFFSNKRILIFTLFNLIYFVYYFAINISAESNRGYTIFITYLSVLNAYAFVLIYNKVHGSNFDSFLKFIINIMLIQMLFVIISIFIPAFRDWALSSARDESLVAISNDFGALRSFGLAVNYTSGLPMAIGISSLFSIYFLIEEKKIAYKLKYFLSLLLFLFAIALNARIGFLPIIFFTILLPIIAFSNVKNIISIISAFIVSLILYIVFYNEVILSDYFIRVQSGLLEVEDLLNGRKTGNIEMLSEMSFLPKNYYDLFFGQGIETFGSLTMSSDIGFIRDIYMFGLLYVILFFSVFYYLMRPLLISLKDRFGFLFIVIFILSLLGYYGKGMIYSSTEIYSLLFFLSVFCCFQESLNKESKGKFS